ncbi:MAG: RsmE family RNA methyltransferase [Planctomycetota bacterium]|jgi:16S rRNA (uracil1498-N3)-methyltransferase
MPERRFYCKHITQPTAELIGAETHHLISVCRLSVSDKIKLFDGNGTLAVASIVTIKSGKVGLSVESIEVFDRPADGQIVIAASLPKGRRLDWLISKCTELGVDRICPVVFDRTVKQPKNPKILERWLNLAVSAAKQSHRIFLPQIDMPLGLPQALEVLKADYPQSKMLFGSLDENAKAIMDVPIGRGGVIAIIGPEGGMTEEEQSLLVTNGAQPVGLTDTILRVETAAIAFAAVLTAMRNSKKQQR